MNFKGFIGGSSELPSPNVDAQRCVNMYVEMIESGTGKDGQTAYLKSVPGYEELFSVGDGPIRCILPIAPKVFPAYPDDPLLSPSNTVLVVSGNRLFRCVKIGADWVVGEVFPPTGYGILTSSGPMRGVQTETHGTFGLENAVFVDGEATYYWSRNTGELGGANPYGQYYRRLGADNAAPNPEFVVLLDGRLIFNEKKTQKFWVSEWNSSLVNPLAFASSEGDPDDIVALAALQRNLYILNERTTEIFANSGNADSPFERIPGGYFEKGCLAPSSATVFNDTLFWLGREKTGQGIVFAAKGAAPQRISTHALELKIASYANPQKATSYGYQYAGHSFYVLNFDEASWSYDMSTGIWHERLATVDGELVRNRIDTLIFSPELNMFIGGDYQNGKVYEVREGIFSENGAPLTRMRRFPHLGASGKRLFCSRMQIDMQTGVGLDGGVQGSDPQIMLRMSKDGGHTWSSEMWTSMGKKIGGIGDFTKRVIWNRLGSFRDCIFEVRVTDPVDVTMIAAEIDVKVGMS